MKTLPITLPTCGVQATTRIEVYSARSLDANAYTCSEHTGPTIAAIEAAGMSAETVPLAPDVERPCGYVYVYATGHLTDPVDVDHPAWCDRADCPGRGRHRSVRLPVVTGQPEAVIADVALTQTLGPGVDPMLSLTVVDGESGSREVVLSLGQGRVLSYQVRRLLDLSKGYPGNRRPSW
ncbi:hypothetical protein [Micromonospora sp. 4G55]|uniref:hypothetical protein n=1 Tax=Micromonospora sp. 4G55 TaxID=2806102 RepID=UPI001A4BAB43|nr:hypothetical protein [Micromonospora sp. 4G55]MBM0257033.1 hypothetical protein [Micromonospora sp. 4G55]